jgi:hypothetical protein
VAWVEVDVMKKITLALAVLLFAGTAQAAGHRTLRVDRPEKGAGAQVTHVRLLTGVVRHRMRAVVLTDTRCNPDAMGVSHCLNRIRLASGKTILVVHNHRMMDMPCLSPGETWGWSERGVELPARSDASPSWARASGQWSGEQASFTTEAYRPDV